MEVVYSGEKYSLNLLFNLFNKVGFEYCGCLLQLLVFLFGGKFKILVFVVVVAVGVCDGDRDGVVIKF